ncbi:hypothetical protein QJQ45_003221 [Haematococcus lacustris]|nr:hypothetical protein QJQ45_003221 [Haematococcus lacustris]
MSATLCALCAWLQLEEEMAEVSMEHHKRVMRGTAQRQGGVVLVDESRTSRVSSVPPCNQAATQPAASEPGPNTHLPAKRNKRTTAQQAGKPSQPTRGTGLPELPAKGKEFLGLGYKRLRAQPPKPQQQQQPAEVQ